jgi:hypothetical protein
MRLDSELGYGKFGTFGILGIFAGRLAGRLALISFAASMDFFSASQLSVKVMLAGTEKSVPVAATQLTSVALLI